MYDATCTPLHSALHEHDTVEFPVCDDEDTPLIDLLELPDADTVPICEVVFMPPADVLLLTLTVELPIFEIDKTPEIDMFPLITVVPDALTVPTLEATPIPLIDLTDEPDEII